MQTQQFKEGDKVKVIAEHRQLRGLNIIIVKPTDVLIVIGYDRLGDVVARFADCADLAALHQAFFGDFHLLPENVVAI